MIKALIQWLRNLVFPITVNNVEKRPHSFVTTSMGRGVYALKRTNDSLNPVQLREFFDMEENDELKPVYQVCAGEWIHNPRTGRWDFYQDPDWKDDE